MERDVVLGWNLYLLIGTCKYKEKQRKVMKGKSGLEEKVLYVRESTKCEDVYITG